MSYHRIVTLKGQKVPGEIVWLVLGGCGGQSLRDRDRVRETNLERGSLDPYLGLAPLSCPEATEFQRNPEMGLQVSQSLRQGTAEDWPCGVVGRPAQPHLGSRWLQSFEALVWKNWFSSILKFR